MLARTQRNWVSADGSSTMISWVLNRQGTIGDVYMLTNLGWVSIDNAPTDPAASEAFAEELARGYGLTEENASDHDDGHPALYSDIDDISDSPWGAR